MRVLFTPGETTSRAPVRLAAGASTIIGRVAGAALTLSEDAQVSRVHATIKYEKQSLHVTDGSTNGTFVNGRRVSEAALADGDILRIGDTLLLVRMVAENAELAPEAHGLRGDAPAMSKLRRTLALVGPTEATVLAIGESGTGKELVARALHAMSRPRGPFVAVNCSAIAESLAESQLFGHAAGSFTGARTEHPGYFRAAHGGALFLDEIGELPLGLQAKLLRAIEERAVTPVGAVAPVSFDVRVVAATNRDLRAEIEAGRFRGDLYARLAEITIALPALRDRIEDVLPLVRGALGEAPPLTADLVEGLLLHDWPYNVRELLKVASELRIRGQSAPALELALVVDRLRRRDVDGPETVPPDEKERSIPTRDELVALLREHHGGIADIARVTGRSRKQVYRWLDAHGLDVESYRRG